MAESLKEKVTKKLVYDAIKQREKANKKKNDDRKAWKNAKKEYDDKKKSVVESIAKIKVDGFKQWNTKLDELNQSGLSDEAKKSQENTFKEHENEQIQKQLEGFRPNIVSYIEDALKFKPKFGKRLTIAGEESDILALAEQKYSDEVESLMILAKLALKQQKLMEQASFDVDRVNRSLAEIPLKIEDKMDEVKTLLEMLMGKIIAPVVDPNSYEFDPNALIEQIKTLLNPVLQLTSPLIAMTGKIPVLGDLLQILTMLQQSSSGGSSTLTKEELKKMFPVLPDIPTELLFKLYNTMITVTEFCMTLPTVLINGIFAMLNVVYSKLKIITSVIPLGNFFPLSLVGAAVEAGPAILTFLQRFPSQMWDLMMGILKKQFAEILALMNPKPPEVPAELKSLINNLKYQKAAKKRAKRELPTYKNATLDIFENRLSAYGYLKSQAETVQKNYKAIYNGNPEKEITVFVDNGYEQYLPPLKNRLVDYMMLGINRVVGDQNKELSAGFEETKVNRDFPSVSAYTIYFNGLVDGSNLSVGLNFDHLYSMEQIAGEYYTAYHKQLVEKYGEEIVLRERMEPKNMTWAKKLAG